MHRMAQLCKPYRTLLNTNLPFYCRFSPLSLQLFNHEGREALGIWKMILCKLQNVVFHHQKDHCRTMMVETIYDEHHNKTNHLEWLGCIYRYTLMIHQEHFHQIPDGSRNWSLGTISKTMDVSSTYCRDHVGLWSSLSHSIAKYTYKHHNLHSFFPVLVELGVVCRK